MLIDRSRAACSAAAGAAALLLTSSPITTAAQSYPARPVRLVVPFPPGGSNDIASEMAKWVRVAKIAGIRGE